MLLDCWQAILLTSDTFSLPFPALSRSCLCLLWLLPSDPTFPKYSTLAGIWIQPSYRFRTEWLLTASDHTGPRSTAQDLYEGRSNCTGLHRNAAWRNSMQDWTELLRKNSVVSCGLVVHTHFLQYHVQYTVQCKMWVQNKLLLQVGYNHRNKRIFSLLCSKYFCTTTLKWFPIHDCNG